MQSTSDPSSPLSVYSCALIFPHSLHFPFLWVKYILQTARDPRSDSNLQIYYEKGYFSLSGNRNDAWLVLLVLACVSYETSSYRVNRLCTFLSQYDIPSRFIKWAIVFLFYFNSHQVFSSHHRVLIILCYSNTMDWVPLLTLLKNRGTSRGKKVV